jgi:hypothetical protein
LALKFVVFKESVQIWLSARRLTSLAKLTQRKKAIRSKMVNLKIILLQYFKGIEQREGEGHRQSNP